MYKLELKSVTWRMKTPLVITGYTMQEIPTLSVEICDGNVVGRGEGAGVYYTGDDIDNMLTQAESIRPELERGIDRQQLLKLLPSGGARNAIDAALWDLEAKRSGKSVWALSGIEPAETETVATVGIDTPERMAQAAQALPSRKIKIKVSGDDPVARIAAVHRARPQAELVIDANQGWTLEQLEAWAPQVKQLGVVMVEQPLPRGGDEQLADYRCPLPLCADESCLDQSELPQATERYDMINIKLDKVGGLTAALELARQARAEGMGLMVGNMAGSSLAMAPGLVLAQLCELVDLDGPIMLERDCEHALRYDNGIVSPLTPALWG